MQYLAYIPIPAAAAAAGVIVYRLGPFPGPSGPGRLYRCNVNRATDRARWTGNGLSGSPLRRHGKLGIEYRLAGRRWKLQSQHRCIDASNEARGCVIRRATGAGCRRDGDRYQTTFRPLRFTPLLPTYRSSHAISPPAFCYPLSLAPHPSIPVICRDPTLPFLYFLPFSFY